MNKLWLVIGLLIVLPIGWYLLSPLFIVIEADEASPLDAVPAQTSPPLVSNPLVKDNMEDMDEETKQAFKEAVEEMSKEITVMDDTMPTGPQVISQASFLPSAHEVQGQALLIQTEEEKILRFEDFDTVNGPELHIYLSSDLGDDDFVDLGIIKATKGNVNYPLSSDIDTEKYNNVLVWCKPFGVLFSYAVLNT